MIGCTQNSIIQIEHTPLPPTLPSFFDDCSLAGVIGTTRKTMWSCFYILQEYQSRPYRDHIMHYAIPKKNKEFRDVYELKSYPRRINKRILNRILDPLQETLGDHVTAYRKGRGIPQAIKRHLPPCALCDTHRKGVAPPKHSCLRHGTYIRMDLENFFHSVRRSHVRNTLRSFGYNKLVATTLSGLLTMPLSKNPAERPRVPQGFPTSGAVCNLVADKFLDQPVMTFLDTLNDELGLINHEVFVYSRYADDIAITCGIKLPSDVTRRIIQHVTYCAVSHGFRINTKKTKVFQGTYRKRLLGGSFARKITVPKKEYRQLRAILHNCATHGIQSQLELLKKENVGEAVAFLNGRISWFRELDSLKADELEARYRKVLLHG